MFLTLNKSKFLMYPHIHFRREFLKYDLYKYEDNTHNYVNNSSVNSSAALVTEGN